MILVHVKLLPDVPQTVLL